MIIQLKKEQSVWKWVTQDDWNTSKTCIKPYLTTPSYFWYLCVKCPNKAHFLNTHQIHKLYKYVTHSFWDLSCILVFIRKMFFRSEGRNTHTHTHTHTLKFREPIKPIIMKHPSTTSSGKEYDSIFTNWCYLLKYGYLIVQKLLSLSITKNARRINIFSQSYATDS